MIEGIVGQHGVAGRNKSGELLLEMCAEQELVVGNGWFKKKDVYKYTWLRMAEGLVVDRALMVYVLLPKRMRGRLRSGRVERRRWRNVLPFLGGHSTEICGWMKECREGVRNVLKMSELNICVKESAYQKSLRGQYEV